MPEEVGSFASIRRRKAPTQFLRPSSNDNCPLHTDIMQSGSNTISSSNGKRFIRWTACFGFVSKLKRPKSKLDFPLTEKLELSASSVRLPIEGSRSTIESAFLASESDRQQEGTLAAASTCHRTWKDQPVPLQPASPLSALSPPPRHAMKERSRSMTVNSSAPWSTSSSSPLLPKKEHQESPTHNVKQKASTIGPALALRLSLDIEQQYSSSPSSTNDLQKKDDQDDTSSCNSSSQTRGTIVTDPKLRLSSIEMSTPPSGPHQTEKRLSLIERRQRTSTTIPDIEKLNISYNENGIEEHMKHGDEEDGDYRTLLNEFRLPSESLRPAPPLSSAAAKEDKEEKEEEVHRGYRSLSIPFSGTPEKTSRELSRQRAMDALEGKGGGARPMDVVRDKAYYDAVVAGTWHHRPWTQYLQTQAASSRDEREGLGEHHMKTSSVTLLNHSRPSLVYFPPSPNSINSEHRA